MTEKALETERRENITPMPKQRALKKRHIIIILALALLLAAAGAVWGFNLLDSRPTLSFESLQPFEASDRNEFSVSLLLSDLPDALYPAASVTVRFDSNKLEFTGIKMGTMMVYDNYVPEESAGNAAYTIPVWTCKDTDAANRSGTISGMYLDMTAGKNAYGLGGFDPKIKNVPLRLGFKLKDSVAKGERLELSITEATFATLDGEKDGTTLTTAGQKPTLVAQTGRISIAG